MRTHVMYIPQMSQNQRPQPLPLAGMFSSCNMHCNVPFFLNHPTVLKFADLRSSTVPVHKPATGKRLCHAHVMPGGFPPSERNITKVTPKFALPQSKRMCNGFEIYPKQWTKSSPSLVISRHK